MNRYRIFIFAAATLSAALWAYACGDGTTEPPTPPPDPPRPTTVTVTPATTQLTALGDTVRLTAEVRDQNGQVMAGAAVTWSSSDPMVATVDAQGLVTAAGNGTATITATAGSASGSAAVTVRQEASPDRAALAALYQATNGRYWKKRDNWLTDVPLGDWHGVEINGEGRVISLELLENGLVGHLPPELGDLAELERLELDANQLVGSIPRELGSLSNLRWLSVVENKLEGRIPSELGDLAELEGLELANNHLLTGPIPPELGRLSKLERLWIGGTGLTGAIPPELGKLSNLRALYLKGAHLTGTIPPELGQLTRLGRLYLSANQLTGGIPPELGSLSNLEDLRLEQNRLTGALPMSVLRITGLEVLQIQENAGLCVPGTTDFVEWAGAIDDREGPFCNEAGPHGPGLAVRGCGRHELDERGWLAGRGRRRRPARRERRLARPGAGARPGGQRTGGRGFPRTGGPWAHDGAEAGRQRSVRAAAAVAGAASAARIPVRGHRVVRTAHRFVPGSGWTGLRSTKVQARSALSISEREALVALYEATDGPNWTNSENWLTDAPLAQWHGVRVDREGRVTRLELPENGLAGRLPPEIGGLAKLDALELHGNRLTGPIPPELGGLASLWRLNVSGNRLTGPIPPELGNLSELGRMFLDGNELTGPIPPELGRLSALETLYLGGGPSLWKLDVSRNRLTGPIPPELGNLSELRRMYLDGNELTGPIPPELGRLSALEALDLGYNPLTGPIPPELGNLSNLRYLRLGRDPFWPRIDAQKGRRPRGSPVTYPSLTGPIPPELGRLTNLVELDLGWHDLTGPIPPELGNLSGLRTLRLESNRLSGSIPPEIGHLSSLTWLLLGGNKLTGPVPSTIGDLSSLEQLVLSRNELTDALPPELGRLGNLRRLNAEYNELAGQIPRQLGHLANLEELLLGFNHLAGSVPVEFGRLASLRTLILTDNAAMSGALPDGLTALGELESLAAGGTRLCAPSDAGFGAWLAAISSVQVKACGSGAAAAAYMVQAVQSREFPVPLVADDDALVRVFPMAAAETDVGIPPVRVRFYVDGRETYVEHIPGKRGPLPTEVYEGSLETSANAVIPGTQIQPGLEMVVEIDPEGTLDPSLGVAKRIPETGRLPVDVRAMPQFRLTIVPFLWSEKPDSAVLRITREMAADPLHHKVLWKMNTLLPIADDYDLILHDPVLTSNNIQWRMTDETEAIRVMEGSDRYHMGTMTGEVVATAGNNTGRRTISTLVEEGNVGHVTHEFGHTMTLGHAPGCWPGTEDGNVDPAYPYSTGITGAWAYDFRDGGALVRPTRADVMAICGGWSEGWISDYHFTKALRHRLRDEVTDAATMAAPVPSLLVWGGVDEAGVPFLEPAFVVDATPTLPDSAGEHRITGRTSGGGELFSFGFHMPDDPHGENTGAGFVFALPVRPGWANALASITLSGPGGSFTLDGETDRPMTILRDSSTGQVRGILRDLAGPHGAQADAAGASGAEQGLETLFSRGIPDAAAWRR